MSTSTEPQASEATAEDPWDGILEDPDRTPAHLAEFEPPRESIRAVLLAGTAALVIGLICAVVLPLLGFLPKAPHSAANPNVVSLSDSAPASTGRPANAAEKKLRRTPVHIYNATDDRDRTTDFGTRLTEKGWVIGEMGVWGAADPGRTTIYYGDASVKSAAELLSLDLNSAKTKYDPTVGKSLYVVISSGYQAG